MSVSASAVAELRKATGAGLMDCKKALQESNGDYEGALDYLRKKGQKVAAKRADRDAKEGVVVTCIDASGKVGVLMALSCETDFVAKNEGFVELANQIAKLALDAGAQTAEEVANLAMADGVSVADKLVENTGKIGEKIEVSSFYRVEGDNLASYIHAGAKIGVIVCYKDGGKADASQFFRSVAMHVAAMNPSILNYTEFDADLVAKETEAKQSQIRVENEDRERLGKPLLTVPQYVSRMQLTPDVIAATEAKIKEELKAEGKPEKIWDRILPGKMERFVADNTLLDQERCLLNQFFALDDSKTVDAAVKGFAEGAEIVCFRRVAVG
ncbi:MAG: elongation factor Ts [Planctomycetales bacterium]|nr:elongation factor Ts [Planctomycetales bacterium]